MEYDGREVPVPMAGYANDMKRLYNNNKGLERRIGFMFEFKKPSGTQRFCFGKVGEKYSIFFSYTNYPYL